MIRRMSRENPLWGAPRIHGELLKLGFEVAQSSFAKYMVRRRRPPSQGWLTFLRNHASDIAAMDLFVVPTISFDLLYAFVIVRLDRRDLIWINVTRNPTAEWLARQIDAEVRAPGRRPHERIRRRYARPCCRQVSKLTLVITIADAVFSPRQVLVYERELAPVQGMKDMRNQEGLRPIMQYGCS